MVLNLVVWELALSTSGHSGPSPLITAVPLPQPGRAANGPLFTLLSPQETGIDVAHTFPERGSFELLQDQGAGAGICAGDFDGDGWPDIFVTHYDVGNRLYRNRGGWRFDDVTVQAGVAAAGRWCAGATAVDIENDGDLDLFVAVFNAPNLLFFNRGDGTFDERAADHGLAFSGASVMMAFGDYDRDGGLDGYLVTHRLAVGSRHRLPRNSKESFARSIVRMGDRGQMTIDPAYRELFGLIDKGNQRAELVIAGQEDRFYRHGAGGVFTNVNASAGIAGTEIGLAACGWDYNSDGWPDLYVSNDYKGSDRLYRNNQDGTFTDVAAAALAHTPWSSMGSDGADINNDGRIDFIATDMAGSTHARRMLIHDDLEKDRWFLLTAQPPQYARNAVFLGTGTDRTLEVAYLTGLAYTDWTWSPKFGDFDNDGWIDLFVANGMSRDFLNADLLTRLKERGHRGWLEMPVLKESNLAFKNGGDLHFERVEREWGLADRSASFGAALADLNRDGDLDLIVMRFGDSPAVYRNNESQAHRVVIRLIGRRSNSWGIGSLLKLTTPSGTQTRSLTLPSGFMSANEPLVHFGLGRSPIIDKLEIQWPSGRFQAFEHLPADHFYTITEPAGDTGPPAQAPTLSAWFGPVPLTREIRHREQAFDDYAREPLLPWQLSQLGPGLAVGDVNGDGWDDFYLSGAAGYTGLLCLGNEQLGFQSAPQAAFESARNSEEMAALFFEADGDGDLDLYVVSGGVESDADSPLLCDRLYLNDGLGHFHTAPAGTLPKNADAGSVVAAADWDQDGDLDLFVGGRSVPGQYPCPARSRLLRNDRGQFTDVTPQQAPALEHAGPVTSALWSDATGDGRVDLLIAAEWGPVKLFANAGGSFEDRTLAAGLAGRSGCWLSLAGGDVDRDGDIDYVVGNLGLNTKYHATTAEPILAYWGDLDGSGRTHLLEAYFEAGTLYPVAGRKTLGAVFPHLLQKFNTFQSYAAARVQDLFPPERLAAAQRFEINTLESGLLLNDGAGRFTWRTLPRLAQIAPTLGLVLADWDGDAKPDLALAQNFHSPRPETGRFDGGMGWILKGDGAGQFTLLEPAESGFRLPKDARALVRLDLNRDQRPDLIAAVNNDEPAAFQNTTPPSNRFLQVRLRGSRGNPTGIGARVSVQLTDSSIQTAEVHAGGGYLSQSSVALAFGLGPTNQAQRIVVRWPTGHTTTVEPREALSVTVAQDANF